VVKKSVIFSGFYLQNALEQKANRLEVEAPWCFSTTALEETAGTGGL
jgi:hypothetical protein